MGDKGLYNSNWEANSRICSKQHELFMCTSHMVFSFKGSVNVKVVNLCCSTDTAKTIAIQTFQMCLLTSILVDAIAAEAREWFTNFRDMLYNVKIALSCLKHLDHVLSAFA